MCAVIMSCVSMFAVGFLVEFAVLCCDIGGHLYGNMVNAKVALFLGFMKFLGYYSFRESAVFVSCQSLLLCNRFVYRSIDLSVCINEAVRVTFSCQFQLVWRGQYVSWIPVSCYTRSFAFTLMKLSYIFQMWRNSVRSYFLCFVSTQPILLIINLKTTYLIFHTINNDYVNLCQRKCTVCCCV